MEIAFIGLGIMSRPMARHLMDAGHSLFLHDAVRVPENLLSAGAAACASGREAAGKAEAVILMVPDTPHVEAALFGAGGVAD